MSVRIWEFRIGHILEAIENIRTFVEGMDFEAFRQDLKTVHSVVYNLTIIGEAVGQVPAEVRTAHQEVPWDDMRRMRNVLVHQYNRIDLGVVWKTVQNDLPPLVPVLKRLLREGAR